MQQTQQQMQQTEILADKKVGVCIYQFADNFMTLFRGELENYLGRTGILKRQYHNRRWC